MGGSGRSLGCLYFVLNCFGGIEDMGNESKTMGWVMGITDICILWIYPDDILPFVTLVMIVWFQIAIWSRENREKLECLSNLDWFNGDFSMASVTLTLYGRPR